MRGLRAAIPGESSVLWTQLHARWAAKDVPSETKLLLPRDFNRNGRALLRPSPARRGGGAPGLVVKRSRRRSSAPSSGGRLFSSQPRLEHRVQYGESDSDFVRRLLEDAGIAFVFVDREDGPALLFSDDLRSGEERRGGPVPWIDDASAASGKPFVTEVRLAHEVRPGKLTIRDDERERSRARDRESVLIGPRLHLAWISNCPLLSGGQHWSATMTARCGRAMSWAGTPRWRWRTRQAWAPSTITGASTSKASSAITS